MVSTSRPYRWNTSVAAEAYDVAAPAIHPYYEKVQEEILSLLPFKEGEAFQLVDLGAGSGRLAERVLVRFPDARVTLVDQSEPFLAIAERQLARFASRIDFFQHRLQDDWQKSLRAMPNVIVSTSAIHHLEPAEKQVLLAKCFGTLAPDGMFINGDEHRPASDADYLAMLEWWFEHMKYGEANGHIPSTFMPTLEAWYDRNVRRFNEPRKSGDDCLEVVEQQIKYLKEVGFARVEKTWQQKLWGVIVGYKR